MFRFFRKACAILRAAWLSFWLKIFNGKSVHIGSKFSVFKSASIRLADRGKLSIGNTVHIGENALVSSLKKGVLTFGNGVSIGANNFIICHDEISIGDNTILAPNVLIYDHDHIFSAENGVDKRNFKTYPVSIGKNCWIGANVVILRGTTIEDNCVVGAGSVLKGHYPKGSLIIQKRETEIKQISD